MTRPNRSTRARSCEGKFAHPTHDSAQEHLMRMLRAGSVRLSVYRCKHCRQFHVGHLPRPRT